jgi:hypothetical protein
MNKWRRVYVSIRSARVMVVFRIKKIGYQKAKRKLEDHSLCMIKKMEKQCVR